MRVKVVGNNATATATAGMLRRMGLEVSNAFHSYEVSIDEDVLIPHVVIDGVDCDLERAIVKDVTQLVPGGRVILQRGGGVQSETAVKITVPANDECRYAVELGVARAFSRTPGAPPETPFLKRRLR